MKNRHFLLKTVLVVFAVLACCAKMATAAAVPQEFQHIVDPRGAGADPAAIAKMDALLQSFIDGQKLSSAVGFVSKGGKVVYSRAFGWKDVEQRIPASVDDYYVLMSQTKAITTVAFMTLVEQGRVAIDDPVSKYFPEIPDRVVTAVHKDGTYETRPITVPMTFVHLMSHTSGLNAGLVGDIRRAQRKANDAPTGSGGAIPTETPSGQHTGGSDLKSKYLKQEMMELVKYPLGFDPGTHYQYHVSTNMLAYLIERISGKSLREYVKQNVLLPLGMNDTDWYYEPGALKRFVKAYRVVNGKLEPGSNIYSEGTVSSQQTYCEGALGLNGPIEDYAKFCQMLLNQGEFNGHRILRPETVKLMTTINRIPENSGAAPGFQFGLGFELYRKNKPVPAVSDSAFAWGGMMGTAYTVDPDRDLVALFYTNMHNAEWLNSTFLEQAYRLVPTSAPGNQTVSLRGDAGGKLFEGIGAISGGGATSVLLKDYPEPQRSQVLDLLFKPKFGASMSALLVEVPGDGNSTQGSEPSHMHTRDDLNLYRGYEWWIMREAKKRNPRLTLDAVAWGAPGWVGDGNFWSQDMANYYVKWIQGLKSAHGLDLDAIGCRNEKGVDIPFAKFFRATLNAAGLQRVRLHGFDNWGDKKFDWVGALSTDPELRQAIDIISNHTMSEVQAPAEVQRLAASLGKPLWNTEEHIYLKGFNCEIKLVKAFNENFVNSGVTKVVNWFLVASPYPIEPYGIDPAAMIANSPWSGFYRTREVLWGYAHYGQFSEVGWTYLNGGCGKLAGGGSFVTLKSPGSDYSIIVETNDARAPQTVTFNVGGGLSNQPLCVWRSNAQEQFVQQASITPQHGTFTLTVDPESIYSISTTTGQTKGTFGEPPREQSFPFPYSETFEGYDTPRAFGYLPRYTADIHGVFELSDRPDGKGRCLRQAAPIKPMSWAPEWLPYTIIGDSAWTDYAVSADVLLTNDAGAGVMGRINDVGGGYGCTPKGYYLRVSPDGAYALIAIDGKAGPQDIGDKENQERLKAEAAAGKPRPQGEKGVATGVLGGFDRTKWHTVKLEFSGDSITGYIDGQKVVATKDKRFSHGMAGLVACDHGKELSTAYYDNLKIMPLGKAKPKANPVAAKPVPIYAN